MDFGAEIWSKEFDIASETLEEQCDCERECASFLIPLSAQPDQTKSEWNDYGFITNEGKIRLLRQRHVDYLITAITRALPSGFVVLDASKPWICYWILHALNILDALPTHLHDRIISTLNATQNLSGGFGGCNGQMAHCAPNYAAVLSLCTLGTHKALEIIDRKKMYSFFLSVKHASGGFRMHHDGEIDTRGTYTVLAIARIMNIMTTELIEGVAEFLLSCQTYEGGFGGEPFNEAHGGYNFCAIAGLCILNRGKDCDLNGLERWLRGKQMTIEGGFQGRTNKLVDSCYSYWQGAAFVVIDMIRRDIKDDFDTYDVNDCVSTCHVCSDGTGEEEDDVIEVTDPGTRISEATDTSGGLGFNQRALQRYILHCAQNMNGGMRDKPSKSRDFYHTCYSLSGLSIAQWFDLENAGQLRRGDDAPRKNVYVYGDNDNVVNRTSPIFNITSDKLKFALEYFYKDDMACTHDELIS